MGAASACQRRSGSVCVAGRRSLTCADAFEQALCTPARPVRDEEAAGSNPATPTQVKGHDPIRDMAFPMSYSSEVQQRSGPEPLERLESLGV